MTIYIMKSTENGIESSEYKVNAIKCSGVYLALDIVGIGWRTVETNIKDISFEITED